MVILKATSFLEGHKRDMGMTFRITRNLNTTKQQTKTENQTYGDKTNYPMNSKKCKNASISCRKITDFPNPSTTKAFHHFCKILHQLKIEFLIFFSYFDPIKFFYTPLKIEFLVMV
jgi:hypothetical protein